MGWLIKWVAGLRCGYFMTNLLMDLDWLTWTEAAAALSAATGAPIKGAADHRRRATRRPARRGHGRGRRRGSRQYEGDLSAQFLGEDC